MFKKNEIYWHIIALLCAPPEEWLWLYTVALLGQRVLCPDCWVFLPVGSSDPYWNLPSGNPLNNNNIYNCHNLDLTRTHADIKTIISIAMRRSKVCHICYLHHVIFGSHFDTHNLSSLFFQDQLLSRNPTHAKLPDGQGPAPNVNAGCKFLESRDINSWGQGIVWRQGRKSGHLLPVTGELHTSGEQHLGQGFLKAHH